MSQWRAYADRGGGYCLGFQFSSTTQISCNLDDPEDRKYPFLRKVIYDETEQSHLVKKYIDRVIEGSKKAFNKESHESRHHASVMAMQAANVLLDMLISFKHEAFKDENEWRLICVTREDFQPEALKFREADGGLVPYRPTYIFDESKDGNLKLPLRSVTFGPSLESVRTRSSIELLQHHIAVDSHQIELVSHEVQIKGVGYSLR